MDKAEILFQCDNYQLPAYTPLYFLFTRCIHRYHCECLTPSLEHIPIDDWFCPDCLVVNDVNVAININQQETSRPLITTESNNRNSLDNDVNELQTIPSSRKIRHQKWKRVSKKRTVRNFVL